MQVSTLQCINGSPITIVGNKKGHMEFTHIIQTKATLLSAALTARRHEDECPHGLLIEVNSGLCTKE